MTGTPRCIRLGIIGLFERKKIITEYLYHPIQWNLPDTLTVHFWRNSVAHNRERRCSIVSIHDQNIINCSSIV